MSFASSDARQACGRSFLEATVSVREEFREGMTMSERRMTTALLVCGVLLVVGTARAEQTAAPGCAKIVAALDESGGSLSAEEIAKKTNTDVETVRGCTEAWRAGMRDVKGPKAAAQPPMPPGCAKIVGVLDQNPGLSADEVATKTSTDVETVRGCTDLWRRTMKGGQ